MATYYLSSKSGNDLNNGTSSTQAWSSFSKLSGKLKAGDTVLLEKGSDFDQTLTLSKVKGTADLPITISSYGEGDNPILSAHTGNGIASISSSYVIVENLTIQDTGSSGIYGASSNNWIVRNVTFDHVGGSSNYHGSINWVNSSNLLFENNTVTQSLGDGIYMTNVNDVIVKDNMFMGVTGYNSDNVQISGNNIAMEGNVLFIDESSNTNKGNFVFQGTNLYAHDNYMEGGSFGMSVSADNVLVENNVIKGHDKYTWSSNLMLTDQTTGDIADNIIIRNNDFFDANRNITIDGKNTTSTNMTVNNLVVSGNSFSDWDRAPLLINGGNVNGVFENNTSNKEGNMISGPNSNLNHLDVANNVYAPDTLPVIAPPAPKTISIVASGSFFLDVAPIMKLFVNGIEVGEQSVTALKNSGQKETINFQIASFYESDSFTIKFVNDKADARIGQDRNLYVHSVSMDGETLKLKSADLSNKVVHQKDGSGMFFSSNASATFTSNDVPHQVLSKTIIAETPFPKLEDILESDNHNIFYGGENHVIGASGSPETLGAGFKDLTSSIADLHYNLSNGFS